MKIFIIACGLSLVLFFTACKNNSSEKNQPTTAPEAPAANTQTSIPATAPSGPTAANAPSTVVNDGPEKVVQKIFDAAKSGDFSMLKNLCDPTGYGDNDTKDICNMASQPQHAQEDFVKQFQNGSVNGNAEIEGDMATVKIKFGPDGTKDEKIVLKKVMGSWYLSDF